MPLLRRRYYVEKQIFHCLVLHLTLGSNDPANTHLVEKPTTSKTHASLMGTWWVVVLAVLFFQRPEEAGPRRNPLSGVPTKDPGESRSRTRPRQDR